jgi:uncharacterized membrane protein YbhN (UPF0104 family)
MSEKNRRRVWLAVKTLLAVAIVVGVGKQFADILSHESLSRLTISIRWELLLPAALLYVLAQTCWGAFWVRLLKFEGVPATWFSGLRAYFISQFGKYIPGKVMVILLRVSILRKSGGSPLAVGVTATYETLTSMAAGAIVGVLLLPSLGVLPVSISGNVTAFLAFAAFPLALGVLNKLAVRIADRKRGPDAAPLPAPSLSLLAQGLLHGICGWGLLGVSLALAIEAVGGGDLGFVEMYLADLGAVSLSYVAGFVVLMAPGGLGVREFVLKEMLTPRFLPGRDPLDAESLAIIVALLLRLSWTAAEIAVALVLYLIHPRLSD